jgi:hypothetical protein
MATRAMMCGSSTPTTKTSGQVRRDVVVACATLWQTAQAASPELGLGILLENTCICGTTARALSCDLLFTGVTAGPPKRNVTVSYGRNDRNPTNDRNFYVTFTESKK